MLCKAFEEESNLMEWLQASNDIVEIEPFGIRERVVLDIVLIFKVEELNSSSKSNSSLE